MPSYGVTLLSGGLDSTTVAAYAKGRVDHMSAITFHCGQSHAKEVDSAVRIAGIMGIEHKLLNQSQGGNYILERWQRQGRCKHQCVGSGL